MSFRISPNFIVGFYLSNMKLICPRAPMERLTVDSISFVITKYYICQISPSTCLYWPLMVNFLIRFTLQLGRTRQVYLFMFQVITVPQQQPVQMMSFGKEHRPPFKKTTVQSSEQAVTFAEAAVSKLIEVEPTMPTQKASVSSCKLRTLYETFKEDKGDPEQGDILSFSTACETSMSSVTTEKNVEETSTTEISVQSGSELLDKEKDESTREKQTYMNKFSVTPEGNEKSVAKTGPEGDQYLPVHEEQAYTQTQNSLFYSPSSPMSSDNESEIEDEDLKVELQKLREK